MGRIFGRRPDPTAGIARAVAGQLAPDERVLAAVYAQRPGTFGAQLQGGAAGATGAAVGGHAYTVGDGGDDDALARWVREAGAAGVDPDLARRTLLVAVTLTDARLLLTRRSSLTRRLGRPLAAWPLEAVSGIEVSRRSRGLTIRTAGSALHLELPLEHRFLPDVYRELPDLLVQARRRAAP